MPWWNPLSWFGSRPSTEDDGTPRRGKRSSVDMGADHAGATPARPGYDPEWALGALSRFPWLYAGAMRRAADAASLPRFLVSRRDPGTRIEGHPFLDLLRDPSPWTTGEEFARQIFLDLSLNGNHLYLEALNPGADPEDRTALPVSLVRLHPARTTARTDRHAPVILGYVYAVGDGERFYPASQVRHVRYPSWEAGPEGLWGQGLIRALHDELRTELAATRQTMDTATNGRPDVVLSPKDPEDVWDEEIREEVRAAYLEQTRRGGPLVLGGAADVKSADWSPADLEMPALRDQNRRTVMAGLQVPPVVLGQETANYATAREQFRVYWQGIRHDVRLVDAQLTRTARRFDPDLEVRTDFSEIEALAVHRTDRLDRARKLVDMGATPAAALKAEGIQGVEVPDERIDMAAPLPPQDPEPRALDEAVARVLEAAMNRSRASRGAPQRALVGADDEDQDPAGAPSILVRARSGKEAADRAARVLVWRQWLQRSFQPGARLLNTAARRYLGAARSRYQRRLADGLSGRSYGLLVEAYGDGGLVAVRAAVDWDQILGETAEEAEIRDVIGRDWRRVWKLAADRTLGTLPVDGVKFDPDRPEVVGRIQKLARWMGRTNTDAIRAIVEDGLAEGLSVGDMQTKIAQSTAFSPRRALRVARTEATRAVNHGTLTAYREAAGKGVSMRKQWLTGGDNVRDSHDAMDQQIRDVDQPFTSGDGNEGMAPGDFDVAAEVVNCKCTMLPVVDGAPPQI